MDHFKRKIIFKWVWVRILGYLPANVNKTSPIDNVVQATAKSFLPSAKTQSTPSQIPFHKYISANPQATLNNLDVILNQIVGIGFCFFDVCVVLFPPFVTHRFILNWLAQIAWVTNVPIRQQRMFDIPQVVPNKI